MFPLTKYLLAGKNMSQVKDRKRFLILSTMEGIVKNDMFFLNSLHVPYFPQLRWERYIVRSRLSVRVSKRCQRRLYNSSKVKGIGHLACR